MESCSTELIIFSSNNTFTFSEIGNQAKTNVVSWLDGSVRKKKEENRHLIASFNLLNNFNTFKLLE